MSEDMSISDLLPLIAAALNDKSAAETAKELATVQNERDRSHTVEVIRSVDNWDGENEDEDVVVYSSGLFEDGQWPDKNTDLWEVTLEQSDINICRLVDLRDCHVCVGGGFPVGSLNDDNSHSFLFEACIEHTKYHVFENAFAVSFCFKPHSTKLHCLIHGWPREEWIVAKTPPVRDDIFTFLVDIIGNKYPDATVQFTKVTFASKRVHGALKRLLSPSRLKKARADKEKTQIEGAEWTRFVVFVQSVTEDRHISYKHLTLVLTILSSFGIKKRTETSDSIIVRFITECEHSRLFETEDIFDFDDTSKLNETCTKMIELGLELGLPCPNPLT